MHAGQDFLAGGGEMGERIRAFDWASTAIGPIARWPQSLRSAVSILLPSRAQIALFWGPELVTLYNDAYRPVFGAKHPRVLGRPIREAWDELWRDGLRELFDGVLRTGDAFWAQDRPFFMERHGYLEETFFDVSYDPVRDESGGVGGVFCIVSETTQRVLGERRMRTLRDLGRIAGEARSVQDVHAQVAQVLARNREDIPFALLYAGREQGGAERVVQVGLEGQEAAPAQLPAAAAPWPLAREATVLGAPQLAAFGALHAGPWDAPVREAMVLPLSTSGARGNDWLVCGASPRRRLDDDYRDFLALVAGHVTAALDSARRSEDEHRRAEALAEVDRAKTAFFSNVSHEFRTPLTLMMGPLDEVLADPAQALTESQRERLVLARRSAERLHKLVNALLDFSRVEAGRAQARFEATDLAALTKELASSFRSALDKAGLRLRVDCPPQAEPAWVDRDLWEKIVLNLLSNAFKFTFEGEIAVELHREGGDFVLTVRDTGVGIPGPEVQRVFERFHRVEGTPSRTHEGSGIGLALVQELARLHGGSVRAQSRQGEGSSFTVTIPAGRAHLDPAQVHDLPALASTAVAAQAYVEEALGWLPGEPAATHAGATQRPRIVLADDNADMREYIRRLLADRYEVETVADGEAALAALRRRAADLLVADVMMPRLDGLALVRTLRGERELADTPVLLLSARAGEGARIEGLHAGADDYLEKPFAARELVARVGARLEIGALRRQAGATARRREVELEEEARRFEQLNEVGLTLAGEWDLQRIVQGVTDAATALSGAAFGAFFYNVTDPQGESYMLYTLSGVPRERFAGFEMPRNTQVFSPTFNGEGVVRVDDITKDARYGHNPPHRGMPAGHLPVRAYLAVPVVSRSGEVLGGLFFGHSQPGVFTEQAERIVSGIAAQAAVAIDNARLHDQRLRLIAQLQESDRRKDEFIATLSHELRNPLAPLRNGLHLLRLKNGAVGDGLLQMMDRQMNQLVRLVDDLLEMSRISRGTLALRREPVDLKAVVRHALEASEPLVREHGHALELDLPERPLWLEGDAARLAQVLSNLLNNACRYTDRGGRIQVSVATEAGRVLVTVRDSGIGFQEEQAGKLFEMFARGERSQGLGIGLGLARRLAELHGGTVEGHSDGPGRGARFTLALPLGAEPAAAAAEDAPAGMPSLRVLVVDDNVDAATTLQTLLELLGARAEVAHGGEAALARFAEFRPRAVLLDIGMPGMDGYQVARALRARHPDWDGALIALTGWGQEADRRKGQEAGFDHHLVKPVDVAVLQRLLAPLAAGGNGEAAVV